MLCDDVRAFVLAPDGALPPALGAHAAGCSRCAAVVAAGARFDAALSSSVVAPVPAEVAAALGSLAPTRVAPALDEFLAPPATKRLLRAALLVEPPVELRQQLLALAETAPAVLAASRVVDRPAPGQARADGLLAASLVAEPPAELQQRLLALAASESFAASAAENAIAPADRVAEPPAELQQRRLALAASESLAIQAAENAIAPATRVDAALKVSLIAQPSPALQQRLLALPELVAGAATERADGALRAEVVAEPPLALQRRLVAMAAGAGASRSWYQRLWAAVTGLAGGEALAPRLGVFAAELAALGVLVYALVQLVAWVSSLPIILGDVPYAIALLIWSPAVDYLAQLQGLLQQLGLWLLVAGAGWIVAQGLPGRQQAPS
ncbi:MAG TPA: hypothetical protein VFS62_12930 [Chloroflexota bacterium]|jgi:hypothetical protein|nr:hypothetical protein [Chloroflexota bacterium]